METANRHNRIREKRGVLKSFSDLPFCAQTNFQTIAKEVKNIDPNVKKVYVFGSYHWGFWDSESDYDIMVDKMKFSLSNKKAFREHFQKNFELEADFVPGIGNNPKMKRNTTLIEIPV